MQSKLTQAGRRSGEGVAALHQALHVLEGQVAGGRRIPDDVADDRPVAVCLINRRLQLLQLHGGQVVKLQQQPYAGSVLYL